MTQLFDTETYEDTPVAAATAEAAAGQAPHRHLRSVYMAPSPDVSPPPIRWQLDAKTIETGRRGIQAARQALQDAARDRSAAAASSAATDNAAPTREAA